MKRNNYVGPRATACKPVVGTGKGSTVFGSIIVSAREHSAHEAGLPGRADRKTIRCRSCGCETTASSDRLCDTCIEAGIEIRACERCKQTFTAFGPGDVLCLQCLEGDARREERAAALSERCRIHRVRYVEDLPVSALEEMQAEWGRR